MKTDDTPPRPLQLRNGLKINDNRYKILDKEGLDPRSEEYARPLGEGATSTVYLCEQSLGVSTVKRALKLMNPTLEVIQKREQANQTIGHSAFVTEIENLAALNHQNLVRIIDAGIYEEYEFLVMDYVPGPTLEAISDPKNPIYSDWKLKCVTDPFLIVRIMRQICWALAYLHERQFFHMDIAPKNIFLADVGGKPHVIVGDLGVAKRLALDSENLNDEILVAGTKEYCPPSQRCYRNTLISTQKLREIAPAWDLFSVGKVLLHLLKAFELTQNKDLESVLMLAETIVDEATVYELEELASELGRLLPDQVKTLGLEELSTNSIGAAISIRIPLFVVPLSKRMIRIIDHPTFSRLRLIPQLLLVRTVYPGGLHTRFEHALGSYEIARRVFLHLISQPVFRLNFGSKQLEEGLLAVLLIQLATYPLHHVVQEALPKEFNVINEGGNEIPLIEWFLDYKEQNSPSGVLTLRETISADFPLVDLDLIVEMINPGGLPESKRKVGPQPRYLKILTAIVRSSIDVRVMDYLVRDAHHTGANSGTNVDIDQIINSMCIDPTRFGLAINKSGVHAVENLLCARYWMYTRIYWNTQNRSLFSMLTFVVTTIARNEKLNLGEFVKNQFNMDEFAALRNLREICLTLKSNDRTVDIIDSLLESRPHPFMPILELAEHTERTPSRLLQTLRGYTNDQLYILEENLASRVERRLDIKVLRGDLLLDIPREPVNKLGEDIDVLIDSKPKSLVSSSHIIASLEGAFTSSAIKLRLFWSHQLRRSLKLQPDARKIIEEEALKLLGEQC